MSHERTTLIVGGGLYIRVFKIKRARKGEQGTQDRGGEVNFFLVVEITIKSYHLKHEFGSLY